ncbi:MAG: hypothetical protein AAFO96_19970, partial [Bacteroidota bacterium]
MKLDHLRTASGNFLFLISLILSGIGNQAYGQSIVQVCQLSDWDSTGGHAIYLFTIPNAPSERYIFDSAQGELVIFSDSTARVKGRVFNDIDSTLQWDFEFWLIGQRDFAAWTALGRDIKIELAPNALVQANKQDWLFWEMDSTRSIMTGVPGSANDGDTLFLSHDPPNREFGFQYGVAANAKDGDFGLSGWFRHTGTYVGHGDINVDASCGNVCDLDVSFVNPHCISDSTFTISVTFTGSGQNYQISDNLGTPVLSGLSAGTYDFGPYDNGTIVDLTILDTDAASYCDTTLTHLTTDCAPPCDLDVANVVTQCLTDTTFTIVVSFTGSGNNYQISDNQGTPVAIGLAPGTYTYGNYPNNTLVDIQIKDRDGFQCDSVIRHLTKDCVPPCDLHLISATPQCLTDTTFGILLTFTGTGSNFQLSDDQSSPSLIGLSAGTYVFGNYPNGTVVAFTLTDLAGLNCDTTVTGITEDCTPPCDLHLLSVTPQCFTDSTFELVVNFSGSGTNYQLSDDQGTPLAVGIAPGTFTYGVYPTGTQVALTVIDLDGLNCDTTVTGLTASCTPPCALQGITVDAVCKNDTAFEVVVQIFGSGSNFVISDDQGSPLAAGLSAGTYFYGTYPSGSVVSITVSDPAAGCDTTVVGLTASCIPPCDVAFVDVISNCFTDSTFETIVTFTGSGTNYRISDDQGTPPLTGLVAGTYTYGVYPDSAKPIIIVTDLDENNCKVAFCAPPVDCDTIISPAPIPVCDLEVTSAAAFCLNNQEFEINLAFTGTGSNFSVIDDQGNAITGVSAGNYTFGPYVTGTVVAIIVTDSN